MSPLDQSLIAFALAAALLTITPGLDTALVLRTAAAEGARRAFAAALGICLGCLAWGALVAVGLGMLLQASELAYRVLKWIGAAYLLYLGVRMIFARRGEAGD
ncbi:MAG: LysE family translocator, partial [Allosphingosinicella sp.]